jgi:hypothetical protein
MTTVPQLGWPLVAGLALVCAVGCSSSSADGTAKHSDPGAKTVTVTTSTQSGAPASAGTIQTPQPNPLCSGENGYRCDDFETPSGNIKCSAGSGPTGGGSIACEIGSGLNPRPPSSRCTFGDLAGLQVRHTGEAGFECRTDVSLAVADSQTRQIPVVAYGAVWHGFGVFCISQETGLTCINRDGHGFFASRQRWRMF